MNPAQAAEILGLQPGQVDQAEVTTAYRRAAMQYHPDRGGSTQMMQAVNLAYSTLQAFDGTIAAPDAPGYGEALNDAINAIVGLYGLSIEVCGCWIWVSGDTKTHKETLKASGYRWASKKFMWYFRPEVWTGGRGNWDMTKIREHHGSQSVAGRFAAQLN
jgi:hypothetical protein